MRGGESTTSVLHVCNAIGFIFTSELPVKIFTDSGKVTNVHAKNIHWCMQGPYIGLYRPITVKTSVSSYHNCESSGIYTYKYI